MQRPTEAGVPSDPLLRLPEVLRLFPVSRSAWYQGIAEKRFPPGVKLSERTVAWRRSDIDRLIQSLGRQMDERAEAPAPHHPVT